jgi:hypothetical protein
MISESTFSSQLAGSPIEFESILKCRHRARFQFLGAALRM